MNKERLELLAAHLEKLPREEFDMSRWDDCGCIGGHTENLWQEDAESALGLRPSESAALFMPKGWSNPAFATPQQAAAVVRHLKNTGKVDWERFVS